MAQQEIGLKLRADTTEAVRSVKQLERTVRDLENVQSRGDQEKGFLNEVDVRRFTRLSRDAERVYKQFLTNYSQVQRDFENKKKDLENAIRRNAGQSTTDQLKREIADLQARKDMLSQQASRMGSLNQRAQNASGEINNMNTDSQGGTMMMGLGKNMMGMMAGMVAFSKLVGMVSQGMAMVKNEEAYMMSLGTRVGGFGGDFQKAREESYATGKNNGYTSSETMQTAQILTQIGGARNKDSMWQNTADVQWGARAMGVDVNNLATAGGTMQKLGAVEDGQMRKFANLLTGAIKDSGMGGRDEEFISAVSGLTQQVSNGQVSMSDQGLNQIVAMQSALGKASPGLKGERGANVLSQLDSGIKSGSNQMDLLLGWGTEFQGIHGRYELEMMKSKGISDPENLKRISQNLKSTYSGDSEAQAMMLAQVAGISVPEATELLKNNVMETNGSKSAEELVKSGASTNSQRYGDVSASEAMRRAKNDTKVEETKRAGGEVADSVKQPIVDWFTGQPEALQWLELGAGAVGAGGAAKGATSWLGGKARGLFGKGIGGGAAGGGAAGGGFWNSVKSGGGKVLGPLGFLMSAKAAGDTGDSLGDWAFGHDKGDKKMPGLFENPLKDEKWSEDRQGAISKGWDWLWGGDNKASAAEAPQSPNAMKGKIAPEVKDSINKQKEIVEQERANLNKRVTIADKELTNLDAQRRNVQELNNMMGKESSTGSSSGGGIFGWLGNMFKGVSSSWSGSDGGSGGIGGVVSAAYNAVGGDYLSQSLKGNKSGLSADDINKWISSKAPKGSLMLGKGDTFLRAAQESGLDPQYLVAHAAAETGWGTSNIAKKKGNFYGIGAFDSSPYASAHGFNGTDAGIVEGAKWISKNYANKGQDTLQTMRHNGGKHEYATDAQWDTKIASIMAGAPTGSQKLLVEVSGNVKNMDKKDSSLIAQAAATKVKNSGVNLQYEFRQGIGGNRS
ncbi:putative endo-beta-N-acetylglucosaminidase precursor [compost metagenome]